MAQDGWAARTGGTMRAETPDAAPWTRRALALPLLAAMAAPARAQEAAPTEMMVAGRRLVLNGTGVRRFLGFEVLRGWLYLERRSTDAATILASPGVKLLRLRYTVSVPRGRLVSGWEDGFREGCGCEMPAEFRARLRDLPAGQVEDWLFLPDRAEIAYLGEPPVRVTPRQGTAMLSSFIGPDVSSAGLRRGLLGQD
ncbi:Chalcone isomerase-like [Roseomonas rosea]|uniref:Chalcone isomerase-like n=1 Tax=Muricoccus roseus TaxID=198092 RepID=A0A1M6G7D3_9PROT|nr:chalcone isomerase family protein [Roseomonas rosea]SHJ05891.1 Chalcone isomerase-like [Roseomonas rosea]